MAGHSHWNNIQHRKGAADKKRGKLWSKMARLIITAARNGGGDPTANLKLRYAMDKARDVSMPKDTIERAIKRGTGELGADTYEELTYEGYGPGGIALLAEAMTDNRNRTAGEVRRLFEKSGGKMGVTGSVSYMFERKGLLLVPARATDEDTLMGLALDAGADDIRRVDDTFEITCDPAAFTPVRAALDAARITPAAADISQIAKTPRDVDTETGQKVVRLIDALDDLDDVQNVYSDLHVTEAMVAE